jgi:DeoR/GlpR family transcriptional regulator of sugar metabolism
MSAKPEIQARYLPQERKKRILNMLVEQGRVTVVDISAELAVSEMTVRRDLAELETEGKLSRVHGGAVLTETAASRLWIRFRRILTHASHYTGRAKCASPVWPPKSPGVTRAWRLISAPPPCLWLTIW